MNSSTSRLDYTLLFLQGAEGPGLAKLLNLRKNGLTRQPTSWRRGSIRPGHCYLPQRRQFQQQPVFTTQQLPVLPAHQAARPEIQDELTKQYKCLLQGAHDAQASLFAEGTKRNHKSNIAQFLYFCLKFKRPVCPTDRDTLMAFARLESLTISYGSLKNIFSSIRFLHSAHNQKFPDDDWQLESTLKALKRELSGAPLQTLPITPDILQKMYSFVDISSPKGLADWSAFLTAFYCMLRKGSAVPKSLESFNPEKELSRKKLSILPEEGLALVLMNYSKTNQFGNKNVVIPMLQNPIKALDPVFHLAELTTRFPMASDQPAFSYIEKGKVKCVTYQGFTKELKRLLCLAGLKEDSYSGHSFRRGGATYLYRLGADPLLIQASGDWASDCYTRYVFLTLDQRLHAQRMMTYNLKFQ